MRKGCVPQKEKEDSAGGGVEHGTRDKSGVCWAGHADLKKKGEFTFQKRDVMNVTKQQVNPFLRFA